MAVINTPVVVSVCHVMRSLEAVVEIRPESARRSRTLTSDEEPQIFFFSFFFTIHLQDYEIHFIQSLALAAMIVGIT